MANNPPVLSICIPTYNRPECIQNGLSDYWGKISGSGLSGKVEICISDNSPGRETERVVERHMRVPGFRVKYRRNGKNLGYDNNLINAMSLASGDYLQFVSDEMIYDAGGMRDIVAFLEKNRPGCAYFPHAHGMPAMEGAPEYYDTGRLIGHYYSYDGIRKRYLAHIAFYLVRKADFDGFIKRFGKRIPVFYNMAFIQDSFILYCFKKHRRAWIYRGKMEHEDSLRNAPKRIGVQFPSDHMRINYYKFFLVQRYCHDLGIIGDAEWGHCRRSQFLVSFPFLFRIRIHLAPGIYEKEIGEVRKYAALVRLEFPPLEMALMLAYEKMLFWKPLPLHLVYKAGAWFNKAVLGKKGAYDFFEFYSKFHSAENEGQKKMYKTDF